MRINCERINSVETDMQGLVIDAGMVRHDLLIESIINDKGVDFVLNAIGCDDALKYMFKESL